MKSLIVFFSHRGENYNVGYLKEGNAEHIAHVIQQVTGGDVLELIPLLPYPEDYDACTKRALKELQNKERPDYRMERVDMAKYDTIFLCYPNWWGTYPMVVAKFLEDHDFQGKKIKPMCTHEGSGMGRSETDLKKALPSAQVLPGLAIKGTEAHRSDTRIREWCLDPK